MGLFVPAAIRVGISCRDGVPAGETSGRSKIGRVGFRALAGLYVV